MIKLELFRFYKHHRHFPETVSNTTSLWPRGFGFGLTYKQEKSVKVGKRSLTSNLFGRNGKGVYDTPNRDWGPCIYIYMCVFYLDEFYIFQPPGFLWTSTIQNLFWYLRSCDVTMIQWLIDLSVVDQVYIAPAVFELVCVCGGENNFIFCASFLGVAFSSSIGLLSIPHDCEMRVPWLY